MKWIELRGSGPVQIHEPLILIQSNPADDTETESSPVKSGHNRVGIYQIPCKIYTQEQTTMCIAEDFRVKLQTSELYYCHTALLSYYLLLSYNCHRLELYYRRQSYTIVCLKSLNMGYTLHISRSSPIQNPLSWWISDPVQVKSAWTGLDYESSRLIQYIPYSDQVCC